MRLSEMHSRCKQCNFNYARIDTEAWGKSSSRRVMCPICGWTMYEEYCWEDDERMTLVKKSESQGFGAYRLIPPGGYTGYNSFHSRPSAELLESIRQFLTEQGWKGYLSLWDHNENRAELLVGHPLDKFEISTER